MRDGNAVLTTASRDGAQVRTPLWLTRYSRDLDMLVNTVQLRSRASFLPVRTQERFLDLTAVYPARARGARRGQSPGRPPARPAVRGQHEIEVLTRRLRDHWAFNLQQRRGLVPMTLWYPGARARYRGNIEQLVRRVAWDQVVIEVVLRFRVFSGPRRAASFTTGLHEPYVPGAHDVSALGPEWYTSAELTRELKKVLAAIGTGDGSFDPDGGTVIDPPAGGSGRRR